MAGHARLLVVLASLLCFLALADAGIVFPAGKVAIPKIPSFQTHEIHDRLLFKTEPTFWPETFNVTKLTDDTSQLSPGYLFIAPLFYKWGWGPQIYDIDGNLIWYGNESVHTRTQDFKVCNYLGSGMNHLCWHENRGYGSNHKQHAKRIFDNTYTQVGVNYTHLSIDDSLIDGHEFNVLDNGEYFLWLVRKVKDMDLTPYMGRKNGVVKDGCFQEIRMIDEKPVFEWCFLDHFNVTESTLYFPAPGQPNMTSPIAGFGVAVNPWDVVHLNSVDKNDEGDYFVCGRHTDQIMKIAGNNNLHGVPPGTVLWRLGGIHGDFDMTNNLLFTKQHSVRHLSTTKTETTFTILDNAWEGYNIPSARYSSGMEIVVNNETMTAKMTRQWIHPDKEVTRAQGNLQNLPNGNVFIDWGARREITEYNRNGDVLYHMRFDNGFGKGTRRGRGTYRAFKFPWVGKPRTSPKLVAYSQTCSTSRFSPFLTYVSWNGATEVKQWRFATALSKSGPWTPAGTFAKDGFETRVDLGSKSHGGYLPHWVSVEALDAMGERLGGTVTQTFVPNGISSKVCDGESCAHRLPFNFDPAESMISVCKRPVPYLGIVGLLLGIMIIEGLNFLWDSSCVVVNEESTTGFYRMLDEQRLPLTARGSILPPTKEKRPD